MSTSISKNYLYNVSYQLLALVTPFITTPYLSRVLGPDGIGIYSYSTSIVSYFILFAALGMANYGQREIAYNQDNKFLQSRTFYELIISRTVLVAINILIYFFLILSPDINDLVYWFQMLNIVAVLFDISWFFQGLEEFGKIVFRNFIIRLLSVVLIFILIQTKEDLTTYILLLGVMNVISGISIWFYLPKYLVHVPYKELKIFRNFSIIIQLFLPQIAIQVYTVLDKTMIGLITNSAVENGYYEQAEKIIKMSLTVVTSLGTVMLPRIAYSFAQGKHDEIQEHMMKSYQFVWFLTIPLFFLFIATSSNFVPWFFGPEYMQVIPLIQMLSILVIAIGLSNVTGIQYMIPTNQQNKLTVTVVIGAIINFLLNIFLIPRMASMGAAIASLIAEIGVTAVQFYMVRKVFNIANIFRLSYKYLLSGTIMLGILLIFTNYLIPSIINTFILLGIGMIIYITLLFLVKDNMVNIFIQKVKTKF